MQAGLGSTSGRNYGAWVASRNWVRAALARPFKSDPDKAMVYSTGSTHLLSAILTRRTGIPTLQLARQWLAPLDGFAISAWTRDPQGIYLGGNEMAMTPSSLLAFGELYRRGGITSTCERLLSQDWNWIAILDAPHPLALHRARVWLWLELGGEAVRYGWGYGGQMVYVVPGLDMMVVMTSNTMHPFSGAMGHRDALHRLLGEIIGALGGTQE